ncbi:MAG: ABC transporter permease [Fimbriimonadia bacterium]|nr:ABC transporter permease [Fimbriimonadia bacterium]
MDKSWVRRIIFVVGLLLLWQLIAMSGLWNKTLFPGPLQVIQRLSAMVSDGSIFIATLVSLKRVLLGYGMALAVGIPLGILMARRDWLEQTLGMIVSGLQALPSICWLPLALLWFGLNDTAILFVVVMGSMVSIIVAVTDGVKNIPPTYVRAARTMGTWRLPLYTEVLLPASLPSILIGAKLGWGYAWRALMSGELLFVSLGLGHTLMMGRELADMSQVIAVMLIIMAIGLTADRAVFGTIENRFRQRWGLAKT